MKKKRAISPVETYQFWKVLLCPQVREKKKRKPSIATPCIALPAKVLVCLNALITESAKPVSSEMIVSIK